MTRIGPRTELAIAALSVLAIAALWLVPPVGVCLAIVALAVVPPWGRTLTERGIISMVLLLGVISVLVPRASSVPINEFTAHLGLTAFLVLCNALRAVPRLRGPIPRPQWLDGIVALVLVAGAGWLMAAFVGQDDIGLLSGLFFSGWDQHGHYTPFANIYEIGSTLWPTIDGSVAWNQWYPSLHSTVWALAQRAAEPTGTALDRVGLLWPYVQWSAFSFAASMAVLVWVAGDLAGRLAARVSPLRGRMVGLSAIVAAIATGIFVLFGSPALLFNSGFTNFAMSVAVLVASAYLSARSWRSARTLGWVLIPLGALAVNGLWTPMVIGLVPSALVVFVSLWRVRRWMAPVWAVAAAGFVGGTVVLQSRAIAEYSPHGSTSMLEDLGSIGAGMVNFHLGLAIALPIASLLIAVVLIRKREWPLAIAVGGVPVGIAPFLGITIYAAIAGGLGPFSSYYSLKTFDALLLATVPIGAALLGIAVCLGLGIAVKHFGRTSAVLLAIAGVVVLTLSVGLVGPRPSTYAPGFASAAGIEAGASRANAVEQRLVAEAILTAQEAAVAAPDRTAVLWDGSATLANLWLGSLHGVLSRNQQQFYGGMPFPYDAKTAEYVNFALQIDPTRRLAIYWFRDVTEDIVAPLANRNDDRVIVVKLPMRSSPLCLECSL